MDITQLLSFAVKEGASDLHLSSGEPAMLRINGDIKRIDQPSLSRDEVHTMAFDTMNDAQRRQFQEKLDIDFSFELGEIARFRVNVFLTRRGEAAVFRVIPSHIVTLDELGMPLVLKDICKRDRGLVLVTGPTGCGKSTTLAAMVDHINQTEDVTIVTIEDPIESVHEPKKALVNQREVGIHTHSFANALRGALREDPDVILVGEMRDLETISLALTAAETGQLVFATPCTRPARRRPSTG
jgi:twitching motility protein PilT